MSNGEIKRSALSKLKGKWGQTILVMIIYSILTYNIGSDFDLAQRIYGHFEFLDTISLYLSNDKIFYICTAILGGPLTLGINSYFLKVLRDEETTIKDMFLGFKYFWNTFLLQLNISIRIILWLILLIVPGIIAALKYSMAFYIMADNLEIGIDEAMEQSKAMMEGHKGDLFVLGLSFIGWYILELLTFGLAKIWVNPYYQVSIANFYENLKSKNDMKTEIE